MTQTVLIYFCNLHSNFSIEIMATDRIVGIDLGTTNSLVAFMQGDTPVVIPGEDGSNLVPSVVALDENNQIIVGNAARKYLIETPSARSTPSNA